MFIKALEAIKEMAIVQEIINMANETNKAKVKNPATLHTPFYFRFTNKSKTFKRNRRNGS